MTRKYYANALDVLPAHVVDAVSEALEGREAHLWFPCRRIIRRADRDRHVEDLYAQGYSAADISRRVFLTERSVWRILAKKRAPAAPSATRREAIPHDPQIGR